MLKENVNSTNGAKDCAAGSENQAMSLFGLLFGCWHRRYSFPLTVGGKVRRRAASVTGTYVVCLDCGQEFPYDWNKMRRVKVATKPQTANPKPVTVLSGPAA